jgi:DNA-binding IclR family transcriptional regulator
MAEKKYIQSIQRASRILHYIADNGTAKLNDICEATGLKTSTAFGILQTLEYEGQITRTDNGLTYTLGLNTLKLGISYLNGAGVSDKIHTLLEELVKLVDETVYFALKVGNRYYYLDYILSSQPLKVVPEEGRFIELTDNTAVAKVFNSTDSKNKYSCDLEEVYVGMNCIGIPYRTAGKVTGCVAFSGPSYRFTADKFDKIHETYQQVMRKLDLECHL